MLYAFDPISDLTPDIHWTEILTIIIVTTMLFEEIRQVSTFYFIFNGDHRVVLLIRFFFKTIEP